MVEKKIVEDNKVPKVIVFVVSIITLLLGIIIGIVLGYYALPHINYTITVQPGTYVFDIGPTAGGIFGDLYKPNNFTSATTKVLDQGSMPIPDTGWVPVDNDSLAKAYMEANNLSPQVWHPSDGPRVLIGPNNGLPCCYPKDCAGLYDDIPCDSSCIYPVACFRATLTEEIILNRSIKLCKDIGNEPDTIMVDADGNHACVDWVREVAIQSILDEQ